MESRQLVAYALIALLVGALAGLELLRRKKKRDRDRERRGRWAD